jgi:hypothetical protein
MPTYIIEGKRVIAEGQLTEAEIDEIGASVRASAARPAPEKAGSLSSAAVTNHTDLQSLAMESGFVMLWTTLLAFLIFRVTAYKYWKKIRVTPVDNGVWCGGIAAALAPFGVMNKIAQRVSINEYAISLIVVAMMYFAVAFVVGFVWRTLKAAPIDG